MEYSLRARIVGDFKSLDKYPYGGHSVMMGYHKYEWQDTDYMLKFYSSKLSTARRRYREFVEKGISDGWQAYRFERWGPHA